MGWAACFLQRHDDAIHTLFYLILPGIKRNYFKLVMLMDALEDSVVVQSSDQTAFSINTPKRNGI